MSTKTNAETTTALKFTKGAFYQDRNERLWCCANARTKKSKDGTVVVQTQQTEGGHAIGDPVEESADAFVKQLSAAELRDYRKVCLREQEPEVAATITASPVKKTKGTKTTGDVAFEHRGGGESLRGRPN